MGVHHSNQAAKAARPGGVAQIPETRRHAAGSAEGSQASDGEEAVCSAFVLAARVIAIRQRSVYISVAGNSA